MDNITSIKITIENPNFKQWVIMITGNFLLWLIFKLYKEDEAKLKQKIKASLLMSFRHMNS